MPRSRPRLWPRAWLAGLIAPAALTGTSARAQDIPPLLADQLPPLTRRYTAVTERVQPGYVTSGIDLGGFTLAPSLHAATYYDDNIYALQTGQIGDEFLRLEPEISLQSNWTRNAIGIDARGSFDRYAHRTSEDIGDYLVTGTGEIDVEENGKLRLVARAESEHSSRQAQDLAALTVKPLYTERQSALADYIQTMSDVKIEAQGRLVRTNAFDGRLPDGAVYGQQTNDNFQKIAMLKVTWARTPSFGIFVSDTYTWTTFRIATPTTPKRNSVGYDLLAGIVFEPAALIRGTIGVGWFNRNYDNSYYHDIAGPSFDGKIQFFPSQLTTLTLEGDRSIQDSGIPTSAGYTSTNLQFQVDHELLRQLILTASYSQVRNVYDGLDRRDRRNTMTAEATYKVNRFAQLDLSYTRLDVSSKGADRYQPFDDDRIMLALTLKR